MVSDNDIDTTQQVKPTVRPGIHTAILGGQMNQGETSDNITSSKPITGFAKYFFFAWIVAVMVVYFLAFGTRFVVSLFGRLGLSGLVQWLQWISDGLMTWFSTRGC